MSTPEDHWIKNIHYILNAARQIPMWGAIPTFPLDTFPSLLANRLGIPGLTIELHPPEWVDAEGIKNLWTNNNTIEQLAISPFAGQMFWMMTQKDKVVLTQTLLSPESRISFSDTRFCDGFYKYVLLQAIDSLQETSRYPDLHPQLLRSMEPANEPFCLMNVAITIENTTVFAKWAISSSMQSGMISHYTEKATRAGAKPLSQEVSLQLRLQVASTTLTVSEWKNVKEGDCILLEHSSYDPLTHKGSVNILLEETPILRGRLKKHSVKIQDYAFYYEELQPMTDEPITPEEEPVPQDPDTESAFADLDEELGEDPEHLWSEPQQSEPKLEELIASRDIPMQLVVEVDRIRMTLNQLLELRPGNVLDLQVKPEQGVYVTVGGKRIARGELIKLGDVLGLKILKIGE